jgi:hypothetical protein
MMLNDFVMTLNDFSTLQYLQARHQRVPGGVGQRGLECQLHALHSVANREETAFELNNLLIFERQPARNLSDFPTLQCLHAGQLTFSASEKLACERRQ